MFINLDKSLSVVQQPVKNQQATLEFETPEEALDRLHCGLLMD